MKMFAKRCYILFILFSVFNSLKSQDLIYLNNGSKFEGIVTEISTNELKYKSFNNPSGPTYVIVKSDVLFIEYKNGTTEVLNKNPKPISPQPIETTPSKKEVKKSPNDIYYLNKNSLMINGLALCNADITLLFDREFAKSHLSVTALAGYNFNITSTVFNLHISRLLAEPKKHYDIGLGINYYPSTRRKAQYFVGIMMKYMNYSYNKEVVTEEIIGGFIYQSITYKPAESYELATMLVNGIQFRITPTINYKLLIGIGTYNLHGDLKKKYQEDYNSNSNGSSSGSSSGSAPSSVPKAYLGMCFGYRF